MSEHDWAALGLVLSTVTAAPPRELVEIGQLAEAHGFDAVFVNEGRGDALACAQAIAHATAHITVGTNIANIYFRHPYLAAASARTIAELSGGRLILGLGMSHRGLLSTLGIDMGDARALLQRYVEQVQQALTGHGARGLLSPPPVSVPLPVYVAANTIESAAVAGAVGDGLMPFLSPRHYLPTLVEAAREAALAAGRDAATLGCILSIPTFISDDERAARSAARYNLAFFAQLPNYRRQWRRAGFKTAMDAVKNLAADTARSVVAAQIPDELIETVCLFGTPARVRRQLEAFRTAGASLPLLAVSPVNEERLDATRKAIRLLGLEAVR